MHCNQCGKEIPKTNTFHVNYNGTSMIVCGKHYAQFLKYRNFLDASPRSNQDANEYEITNDGVWIYTFNRKNEPSGKFLIDQADLELVMKKKWRFWRGYYYTGNYKPIQIHRYLLQPDDSDVVDHINGNPADNRRSNLRITKQCKNTINRAIQSNNTVGITGVWWDAERKKWAAEIKLDGIKCYLGRFNDKADAAYARYIAEKQLFKEFRSDRNDHNLIPLAESSRNKEHILADVTKKLNNKYTA